MKHKIISCHLSLNDSQLKPEIQGISVGTINFIDRENIDRISEIGPHDIVVIEDYPSHIPSMNNPVGIIRAKSAGLVSHASVKARFWGFPVAVLDDISTLKVCHGKWCLLHVREDDVHLRLAMPSEIEEWEQFLNIRGNPILATADKQDRRLVLTDPAEYRSNLTGYKISSLSDISRAKLGKPAFLKIMTGIAVPYVVKDILHHELSNIGHKLEGLSNRLNIYNTDKVSAFVADHIRKMELPENIWSTIKQAIQQKYPNSTAFHVRTSTNAEDLPEYPGVGANLYVTTPNIRIDHIPDAIIDSYVSLWAKEALIEHIKLGIKPHEIHAALQILPSIRADHSFVIHTAHPEKLDKNVAVLELVEGQCDTITGDLCPGRGTIYHYNKESGELTVQGLSSKTHKVTLNDRDGGLMTTTIDGSMDYYTAPETLELVKTIFEYACRVEEHYHCPQDMEGSIKTMADKPEVYLFQSRAQMGFTASSEYADFVDNVVTSLEQKIENTADMGHAIITAGQITKNILNLSEKRGREFFIIQLKKTVELLIEKGATGDLINAAVLFSSIRLHEEVQEVLTPLPHQYKAKLINIAINRFMILLNEIKRIQGDHEYQRYYNAYTDYSLARFILSQNADIDLIIRDIDPDCINGIMDEISNFMGKSRSDRENAHIYVSSNRLHYALKQYISDNGMSALSDHQIFDLNW